MPEVEDWLQDPLKSRQLKTSDDKQNGLWRSFHFATRLKLDGADHFCRQVLGAASMPYDQGLPLLAHRQLEWYLDAFFFELMSAHDILLQELNIVYEYDLGLKPEQVRWDNKNRNKFMQNLPPRILEHLKEEREKNWFDKIQRHRNTTAHHRLVPIGLSKAWWGNNTLDASHHVSMHYRDKEGNFKSEKIEVCKDYLKNMVMYISSVWKEMVQEFE